MPQLCYLYAYRCAYFFLPFACLPICLSVFGLSVCLSVVCHSTSITLCLPCLYLFACFVSCLVYQPYFLSVNLSNYLSVSHLSVCLCVWLSVLLIPDFNPFVPDVFSLIWSKISWGWILCDPTMPRGKRSPYFFLYKYVTKKVSLHRNFYFILNSLFTENHLRK